ncbi:hypothetical protein ACFQ60_32520 [Streptomyces zhihengii]
MKRKLVIATLTAAVLVGGGAYTAVAVSGDDAPRTTSTGAVADEDGGRDDDRGDDRDDARDERDDRDDRDRAAPAGGVTAAQAAAAALGKTPARWSRSTSTTTATGRSRCWAATTGSTS